MERLRRHPDGVLTSALTGEGLDELRRRMAATLEQGADWCEKTLGVTPAPGGKHAGVGTHNRLLSIAGDGFAQAYLEIIALDPDAPPPQRPTWFGLGDAAMQARLREPAAASSRAAE